MDGAARERIFLYGTLRRGGSRDVLKFYEGVEFVAMARVCGVLHDLGEYPGLRLDPSAGLVLGELFDADPAALAGLDDWEGMDPLNFDAGEYRRVRALASRDDGVSESCWVYEIDTARCAGRPVIASGDWLARERLP